MPTVYSDDESGDDFEIVDSKWNSGIDSRNKPGNYIVEEAGTPDEDVQTQLDLIDEEIQSVHKQIADLQGLSAQLKADRLDLLKRVERKLDPLQSKSKRDGVKSKNLRIGTTNYLNPKEAFEWSGQLKQTMRDIWGIKDFRLCQEGVCNANMDGRDILCVMPTGGGKSLTYQLPALLSPGTTIVISPLLSLIADQIAHLKKANVPCVMLTGATSKEAQNEAFRNMKEGSKGGTQREIKLCYVTPEKVEKSKRFKAILDDLAQAGRLARFVIDEAHCCSALGHDFRPDYKKLNVLKTLFPKVPILAVTATLSKKVLPSLLETLGLPALTPGEAANSAGTCAFSSPLYRPNLRYSVIPKPVNANTATAQMASYITTHYLKASGIVYCLSKKDAETTAAGLMTASGGAIKAGVYHADVPDREKQAVHENWKAGKIQ